MKNLVPRKGRIFISPTTCKCGEFLCYRTEIVGDGKVHRYFCINGDYEPFDIPIGNIKKGR